MKINNSFLLKQFKAKEEDKKKRKEPGYLQFSGLCVTLPSN